MKTTVEIEDELLKRALRAGRAAPRFVLADRSVGERDEQSPLEALSWQKLREEIYGGGDARRLDETPGIRPSR